MEGNYLMDDEENIYDMELNKLELDVDGEEDMDDDMK